MHQSYLKAGVHTYRELLLRLKAQPQQHFSSVEERAVALQQAKARALVSWKLRLQGRNRPVLDPKGALSRLKIRARSLSHKAKAYGRGTLQRYRALYNEKLAARGLSSAPPHSEQQSVGNAALQQADTVVLQQQELDAAVSRVLESHPALRAVIVAAVGTVSHTFMKGLTTTRIMDAHHLDKALSRPPGQALITVSNHIAALDDPLVTSALLPMSAFLRPSSVRWTLCATDRCFKNEFMGTFFRAGQVLPVERGAGLSQPGVQAAEQLLRQGQWVHIFPEGTRSRDGRLQPARKGVGRLVASCDTPPIVVPFVHKGMEGIMSKGSFLPKMGRSVDVVVGEPLPVADLLTSAQTEGWTDDELYKRLADRIGGALQALYVQLNPEEALLEQPLSVVDENSLMPLIEDELDSMGWLQRRRQQWTDGVKDRALTMLSWTHHHATLAPAGGPAGAPGALWDPVESHQQLGRQDLQAEMTSSSGVNTQDAKPSQQQSGNGTTRMSSWRSFGSLQAAQGDWQSPVRESGHSPLAVLRLVAERKAGAGSSLPLVLREAAEYCTMRWQRVADLQHA